MDKDLYEKTALMVVIAHPDDESYFTGALPYYCIVRKLPVILISLTDGGADGKGDIRKEELKRACKIYGMKAEPIVADFPDCRFPPGLKVIDKNWTAWGGKNKVVEYLVGEIRRYKPDVLLTLDFDGEYGHPNHKVCALSVVEAYKQANGFDRYPEQEFLPWQPKKLYVHLWKKNSWYHRWDMSVNGSKGKTAFEVGVEGLRCHVSQGFDKKDIKKIADRKDGSSLLGLYASEVGYDIKDNDLFENVDLVAFS